MNSIGIAAYLVAWAGGLGLTLHYIALLRAEAPSVYAAIFKDEMKMKNDWRLFMFILKGRFDELPASLQSRSHVQRIYIMAFLMMLCLTPLFMK